MLAVLNFVSHSLLPRITQVLDNLHCLRGKLSAGMSNSSIEPRPSSIMISLFQRVRTEIVVLDCFCRPRIEDGALLGAFLKKGFVHPKAELEGRLLACFSLRATSKHHWRDSEIME